MSSDNLFFTFRAGKMLPNDKDNKLIHNYGGPLFTDKLTKQVKIHMYNIIICEKKASTALDILFHTVSKSYYHAFSFLL